MDETTFRSNLTALGCADIREVHWEPQRANPEHAHDYTAHVMILAGEFTLTTPTGPQCYRAGETFSLQAGILHQELAGPAGARVLAGRLYH